MSHSWYIFKKKPVYKYLWSSMHLVLYYLFVTIVLCYSMRDLNSLRLCQLKTTLILSIFWDVSLHVHIYFNTLHVHIFYRTKHTFFSAQYNFFSTLTSSLVHYISSLVHYTSSFVHYIPSSVHNITSSVHYTSSLVDY